MRTLTASGIVGVILFSEIRYLHRYLTRILTQFLNTSPISIESMHVFIKTMQQLIPKIIWFVHVFIIYRVLNFLFHYILIIISCQSFQAFYFRSRVI